MCWKVLLLAKETSLRRRQRCAPLLARRCRTNAMFSTEPSLNGRISVQKIFRLNMTVHSALRSATPWVEHSKIPGYFGVLDWSAIHMRECWALKVTECRIALQFVALLLDIFLQWTTPFITISISSQPSKYEFITIFINTMLIWVSYLSSYLCFCHEVFSKRKFWIGLWSGVWIALQKYCWSDPRIALQKLYWIGVWIAFQKFWSVQCTAHYYARPSTD